MQPGVHLILGLRAVALGDPLSADALDPAEGRHLVVPDLPDLAHAHLHRVGIDLLLDLLAHMQLQRGGQLSSLDAPGQVDLLRGVQQGDLADLLQIHANRVVGRRLQQVDLDANLGRGVGLLTRHLDDLDALGGEVVAHLGEELLDLLGREVVDRNGFEQVLGRDEATFPPLGGDGLLDLVEAQGRIVAADSQRISS